MCAFYPRQQLALLQQEFDPIATLRAAATAVRPAPWDSIKDFACHPSFCGVALYPRQITLLRLIFLETDQMTAYDIDVIEEWRQGFKRRRDVFGVQPDIWERIAYLKARGARRFPHIQFVGGRRGSKGLNGGLLGCEQAAYFYSLDDWQAYYGVDPGKDGYLNVGATSQTQAKQQLFADIRSMVERCKYLQSAIAESKDHILTIRTPADIRRIGELEAAGVSVEHSVATLVVQALSASAPAFRGTTAFGLFLDEFAHMVFGTGSVKSGDEIYEDAHPSLDQFDLDALTYIPTSPYRKAGKAYSLYQEGSVLMSAYHEDGEGIGERARHELTALSVAAGEAVEIDANPTMLIVQLPSWGLYLDWERGVELIGIHKKRPIQPGPEHESQQRRKLRNPEKFQVERAAQWAEVEGAYLEPGVVDRLFTPPDWLGSLESQGRGYLYRKYRIHADPGKTGANFALCVGHLENAPCDVCGHMVPYGEDTTHACSDAGPRGVIRPHCVIDMMRVWKPQDFPPDPETGVPTINYMWVQRDIEAILTAFPSTTKMSFDQWNSVGAIHALREKFSPSIRVAEATFTERENFVRFERVKSALNLGWVSSFRDTYYEDGGSLLEMELRFLQDRNGRIVKQEIGPVTTKDLADAFCVVVADLLHDALERFGNTGRVALTTGSSNVAALKSGREAERLPGAEGRRKLAALYGNGRDTYMPSRASSIKMRETSQGRRGIDHMIRGGR